MNEDLDHIEEYGDPLIESYDRKVPGFLKWSYVLVPIWGIIIYVLYFNGSHGWLDRGYWGQLQIAAKTTYPIQQFDTPKDYNEETPQW